MIQRTYSTSMRSLSAAGSPKRWHSYAQTPRGSDRGSSQANHLGTALIPQPQLSLSVVAWRREWDLNPRCPLLDTTVFETAPFGRSGIPPSAIVRGAVARPERGSAPFRSEEIDEEHAAFVVAYARDHRQLMV